MADLHPSRTDWQTARSPKPRFVTASVRTTCFLIEFARAYALLVYKSPKLADMREAAVGLLAILHVEMNLHVKLCVGWVCPRATLNKPRWRSRRWPIHATCSTQECAAICWHSSWRLPLACGYAEIATRLAS
ncbi:hypothetical protein EOW77_0034200 [Bradyrhizobium yuanmingense]|nr:hypothetical protein EOW77_0034200 [Bradyrhizobium yuanmingense]